MWFVIAFILSMDGSGQFVKNQTPYATVEKCNAAAMELGAPPHADGAEVWLQCIKLGSDPV